MATFRTDIKWKGKEFTKQFEKMMVGRLGGIGALLRRDVLWLLRRPFRGGGKGAQRERDKAGKFRKGGNGPRTRYNPLRRGEPSKPGEPPRADLGRLRQSVFSRVDKKRLNVAVGVTVKYGLALEIGTSRMRPRPYLRPALNRNTAQIQMILTGGGKKGRST